MSWPAESPIWLSSLRFPYLSDMLTTLHEVTSGIRTRSSPAHARCFACGSGQGNRCSCIAGEPEDRAVISVADVGQFVNEDVVDEVGRELHRGPVDVEPADGGAGAPAVAKRKNAQVGDLDLHPLRPRNDAPSQPGLAGLAVPVD